MHVPRDLRIITNAVKNEISHLQLNIPILGKCLVFLEMDAPSSDNILYKQLNSKKKEWIQVIETNKLVKTFILIQTVKPEVHNRAQTKLLAQIDAILYPTVSTL